MEKNNKSIQLFILSVILIPILTSLLIRFDTPVLVDKNQPSHNTSHVSESDSLRDVISDLESRIELNDKKFDEIEKKYINIITEYEIGIDRIEQYHPIAYRDFHRVLSYKETFTREGEKENIKRLEKINIK